MASRRTASEALARALLGAGGWESAALAAHLAVVAPSATAAWREALAARVRARFGADPRPRPLAATLARFVRACVEAEEMEDEEELEDEEDLDDEDLRDPAPLDVIEPLPGALPTIELGHTQTHHMLPARGAPATWSLPALTTQGELAAFLGLGTLDLDQLTDRRSLARRTGLGPLRHYTVELRAKAHGGHRVLERPKPLMKRVQRRILRGLLDLVPPHDAAHGFRRGRSARTHALLHAGREVVLRFDLRDFFATVHDGRVLAIFRTAGYPEAVARDLLALTTHALSPAALRDLGVQLHGDLGAHLRRRHLPQGAPTSPAIANLAAHRLDLRLAGLARALDARYSRYADDLVLSGDRRLHRHAAGLEARVGAIALECGFALHHAKTRARTRAARQVVGGWVVNAAPAVSRAEYDRLRAILHEAIVHGVAQANREGHPRFAAHLGGRIARVAEVSPRRAEVLRGMAARVVW